MNSYTNFAPIYDRLMREDIDYDRWADYIEDIFSHFGKTPELICDLGCGTGNITIPMAKKGYDMIGIDNSPQMLSLAREKAANDNLDIMFLSQSFTKLDLYGGCDAFLCMIDGFNYVLSPKSLFEIAKKIKTCFLEPGGIIIFDLSSRYKLENYIGNNTFVYDKDGIFYVWENKFHEKSGLSDMYINFFEKTGGRYRRFCERHLQKAYDEQEIKKIFLKAGFETVDCFSPLSFYPSQKTDLRTVFVAK
jgi:ubiquinone/menaquinone biosynthesis C-methylase UbiE